MSATKQAYENRDLKVYAPQLERLDARLDEFLSEDHRQFMIVRAHRYGVPIYEYCGGVSTKEYGIKQDTLSCVASITKPVAAALIMKLQEDGLLDVVDSMSMYFDSFKGDDKESIQIYHLLTHTSGIIDDDFFEFQREYVKNEFGISFPPDGATDEEWRDFEKKVNQKMGLDEEASFHDRSQQMLAFFKPTKKPCDVMSYCNFGYRVIGKLVEKVSGMTIDEYAKKVIFEPLGMADSHFFLPEEKWQRMAGRNEKCCDQEYLNSEHCFMNDMASGGMKTTVIDMCRFGDMILGGGTLDGVRILSPASIREMSTNHNLKIVEAGEWDSWGLGFNVRGTKKDDAGVLRSAVSLEHGGAWGHKFLADPEYGVVISVFTGEYDPPGKNVFYPINNMIISALD